MKLLFDQNLAPGLVRRLAGVFPGSEHVRDIGLSAAQDVNVWEAARSNGFAIATKDDDFRQRALLYGPPPAIVWLKVGNSPTALIEQLLRRHAMQIERMEADPSIAMVVITTAAAYAVVRGKP